MSWKQLWIVALAVVALVSSPATAQDEKNQLAGILGRTFISNEGIKGATFSNPFVRFGNGLTFEVNYSRYLITGPLFALSGEVPVVSTWTRTSILARMWCLQTTALTSSLQRACESIPRHGGFSLGELWRGLWAFLGNEQPHLFLRGRRSHLALLASSFSVFKDREARIRTETFPRC
jgi:hypothetical protein